MSLIKNWRGGLVAFALAVALLGGCGSGDGSDDDDDNGGGGGGGLGNVPLGASQLPASQRAAVALRLNAIATQLVDADPTGAAAVAGLAAAIASEGWVTGVDATTALELVAGDARLAGLVATGRWGIFGGEIAVVTGVDPETQLTTGDLIRGVAMLRDSTVVVGYKRWPLLGAEPAGVFPTSGTGSVFEGSQRAWTAIAGGVNLTTADSLLSACNVSEPGIECINASFANGTLGISTSQPVPGTGATGSYTAGFGSTRLRGYRLDVICEQSTRC